MTAAPRARLHSSLPALVAVLVLAGGCSSRDAGGSGGPPGEREDSPPALTPLQDALGRLDASGFSGVVLVEDAAAVTVEAMGMADRETGVPNERATVFDIGSITKQFTAAAILRLEMDRRLRVEDTVGRYLDGLPPDKAAITLHQLLTHTAGLPEALGDDGEPIDREAFIHRVADTPLRLEPGTGYEYSNVGYSLLAAVIEVVTGGSYEEYLHDALFEPASMASTGYVMPDFEEREVAVGYAGDEPVGRPQDLAWADDGPYWHLRGNGGILSTADDMYQWHLALLGDDILDDAARQKLYARHTSEGAGTDTFYGYGWVLAPTPFDTWLITHNGGNGAFFADFLRFVDEDLTIFLATNAARVQDEEAAYGLAATILGARNGD